MHFKRGRFEDSIRSFRSAIEEKPHNISALDWIWIEGFADCADDRFRTELLSLHDELVRRNRDRPAVYAIRAAKRIALDEVESASEDLNRCYELLRQVERDAKSQLGTKSKDWLWESVKGLSFAAASFALMDRPTDAIEPLTHAIQLTESKSHLFPENIELKQELAELFRLRANHHLESKHFSEAVEDYSKVIEIAPENASIWSSRKVAFANLGQFDHVITDLEKTIELLPGDHRRRYYESYLAGLVLLRLSDDLRYRHYCGQIVELAETTDVANVQYFAAWTCALAAGGLEDYSPAISLATTAVKSEPENQQYNNGLGAILMRAGEYAVAKQQLEEVLGMQVDADTSTTYTRYFLAMTEHELGNSAAAEQQLRQANATAETELAGDPAWNRRLTIELLRKEANGLIDPQNGDTLDPARD